MSRSSKRDPPSDVSTNRMILIVVPPARPRKARGSLGRNALLCRLPRSNGERIQRSAFVTLRYGADPPPLVGSSRVSQPEEAGEGARSHGVRDFTELRNVAM